jgi:hypothetical protein
MPYAKRDYFGHIESLHIRPGPGAEEAVDASSLEVREFLGLTTPQRDGQGPSDAPRTPLAEEDPSFSQMDANFVRVLEDIIDLLIIKNVIAITELPVEAQVKLSERRRFRGQLSSHALKLFNTDFGGFGDR